MIKYESIRYKNMITFLFNEIDKHLSYMELNIIDFKQLNMNILCFSKDNDIFTDSLVLV